MTAAANGGTKYIWEQQKTEKKSTQSNTPVCCSFLREKRNFCERSQLQLFTLAFLSSLDLHRKTWKPRQREDPLSKLEQKNVTEAKQSLKLKTLREGGGLKVIKFYGFKGMMSDAIN